MSKSATERACSVPVMQRNTKNSQLNPDGLNWERYWENENDFENEGYFSSISNSLMATVIRFLNLASAL